MNDYQRLQDYLFTEKTAFDSAVASNPNLTQANKLYEWRMFMLRMQPTARKIRQAEDALAFEIAQQEAVAFEERNKQILRRLAG